MVEISPDNIPVLDLPVSWKKLLQAQEENTRARYNNQTGQRNSRLQDIKTKPPVELDDEERVRKRRKFTSDRDGLSLERLIGASDLFPICYLEAGLLAARSICRIEVRDRVGRVQGHGTGFMVSKNLMMTNNHVLPTEDVALYSLAQFNYETDVNLMPKDAKSFRLLPDQFFISNVELDYTLVAVEPCTDGGVKLSDFGFLPLIAQTGKALVGEYVSIIQHPGGAPKAVAIRENQIVDIFDHFIHYVTDTDRGSSGAPVFSDEWKVVALHHSGVEDPAKPGHYVANEGIRVSSIVNDLKEHCQSFPASERALLEELLAMEALVPKGYRPTANLTAPGSDHLVTGIGDHSVGIAAEVGQMDASAYKLASGYKEDFLGKEYLVPLPQLTGALRDDIAMPSASNDPVLKYTHFSILMRASRRLAFYTAVNISGKELLDLKRENDRWYYDPRLDKSYQCGPDLYAGNKLDRGHLVRRLDPVWGDIAVQANEDTFHFTNCSPQHTRLNTKTWLNLEDYILESAGQYGLKVSVFTGPVFRDDDMVYRDVQVPAEFWKVVAVVNETTGKLSSTAYIQTQKNLLDDLEFAYGEYKTYQVPISRIERLTGLNFGDLRTHDPIAHMESTFGARLITDAASVRI